MALSQNVLFSGPVTIEQTLEHPRGGVIARGLKDALGAHAWEVSDLDNWRDSGWVFSCARGEARAQIVLAGTMVASDWMLQVSPAYVPGILGRLFGGRPSAPASTVYTLARDVHSILLERGFRDLRWCWDRYPKEETSTPEPVEATN